MTRIANAGRAAKAKEPRRGPERLPVVYASVYAPAGDRGRYLIITSVCPYCGGRHAHYDHAPGSVTRKQAGCRSGRYLVSISRTYRRHGGLEAANRAAA